MKHFASSPSGSIRARACAVAAGLLLLASAFAPAPARAQSGAGNYPNRPVRLIIPFPPGGSNDILGRILAARFSERFGQQMVTENRPGADGIIGSDLVAKSPPDGYTLLVISTSFAINPASNRVPYDAVKDFAAVGMLGDGPTVISAHPSFPARDVRTLIAMAKARPGELAYASSGTGGIIHLTGELFCLMAGVKLLHVPYKGSGLGAIDVVGGQIPLLISTVASALPQLKHGRLRPLGVGSTKRSVLLPEVPTIAEAGVTGFDARVWWGLLAPAKTPRAVVERLDAEMARILEQKDVREQVIAAGAEPGFAAADPFGKLVADDVVKWAKIARQAGVQPPK
jgi:tripartite-type tricarboxylate transporter receptor subunit TctC